MSFTTKPTDRFATVFDRSPYQSLDPIVKLQHVPKNNVVFGRTVQEGRLANLIYIGKVYENSTGPNYLAFDSWLDTTFPHVIYITGTRGSGKSFNLGVLIEGISALGQPCPIQNDVDPLCSIVIDTQSQFWTLNYEPNASVPENESQLGQLQEWNIKPNVLSNCHLYIPPKSQRITGTEQVFHVRASHLTHEQWCALIGEEVYSPQGHVLGKVLDGMTSTRYSIEDMIRYVEDNRKWTRTPEASRNAVSYKLQGYERTGLFDDNGLDIIELLQPGRCNVFLLRDLRNEDIALITGLIARQVAVTMGEHHKRLKVNTFFGRSEHEAALPSKLWLFVDEAQIIAPSGSLSPATDALVDYVKRGRDAGLSLVMATQQPSAVDDRILSQVNISFSHRLSFQADINAAINRIPNQATKTNEVPRKRFVRLRRYAEIPRSWRVLSWRC